jgi:hypothetical protein
MSTEVACRAVALCEGRETSPDISEEIELVLIRVY